MGREKREVWDWRRRPGVMRPRWPGGIEEKRRELGYDGWGVENVGLDDEEDSCLVDRNPKERSLRHLTL